MFGISDNDLTALWITLKLAVISTSILMLLSAPLAWWLAHTQRRSKVIIEALVAMPLVLPPTVMGFYLLVLLGPRGAVGGFLEDIGVGHLAFTFTGLVIGSMIYSLPFVVQPLQNAFASAGGRMLETAATLRANPLDRFISVVIPLARRGILTAAVLSFAHTLGEFGMILMIGGNIPGQTQVASIAIYDHVEAMDYASAHSLSLLLVALAFILLMSVYALNRRFKVVGIG
ncbi:molybdate ABC transporter permease subunit [Halorhodospira halochloris]|uniref:Molybdenum transport system permease n=1 Tax=Halorhodospira halochloris TaxID=1052 RepID=A0A0X8X7C4_HALHR|nr:molybdate ABC transporter permease subunit [Halorhodospira halochloris]MBK1652491.1 molybdate ABC transporter permease subunit [Halorhodospira halochloris]MCG5529458.1 molybdate ABC transporter permease subunit [Halorhodospira halochloris]MCG5547435.1 molybdate ABC transporter permease subunit [Halorhodospira halochloris]BAU56387.1 molybdenum transport system permease protein ModB [Halorhodospira halochloris]